MSLYYQDESVTLHHGDSLSVLKSLPDGSVNCCVTSPPYYGLRDYGEPGQYGLEKSPAEYVENMRVLFAEVRRVLADDGVLWLNIGDSYSGSWGNQGRKETRGTQRPINAPMMQPVHDGRYGDTSGSNTGAIKPGCGLPPEKNLLGIPWRTAFALQDDGWILRNDIIWSKPNAMPESVTDRLSSRHEHLFMFSKSRRYWFDLDPIREQLVIPDKKPYKRHQNGGGSRESMEANWQAADGSLGYMASNPLGRNPGDVWTIPTQPFPGAHFAVFPVEIPRRCIAAGCAPRVCAECGHKPTRIVEKAPGAPRERSNRDEIGSPSGMNNMSGAKHAAWKAENPDVFKGWTDCGHNAYGPGSVLDPFSGSGTTGLAAAELGRKYVGIDLSREYLDLSLRTRLAQTALLDGGAA